MQEKKTAETDEPFKGVDAFTKFFADNYWDKTTNVIFDLAHGWAHWIANMWGMLANQGQMKYKENRRQFEHDLGRFMDRDGNPVTPWMANKTRGILVQDWAQAVLKLPLGWESITQFFEKPFQAKIAEKLAHAGDLGNYTKNITYSHL